MKAFVFALFLALALAQQCKKNGCSNGNCCSYWGYCGKTNDYCGTGKYQCACDCNGKNPCKGGSTPSTPTTPTTGTTYCVQVGNSYLNVRSGPSTGYSIVGKKYTNNEVTVYSTSNGWGKISSSAKQYVSMSYLVKGKCSTPAPAPTTPAAGSTTLSKRIREILDSLIGTAAKEYGGADGTQCVELPKYYLDQLYHQDCHYRGLGNGNSMYYIIPSTYPKLFQQINYYDGMPIKAGDIISMDSRKSPQWGHAVVAWEDGSGMNFCFLEQWAGSGTVKKNCNPSYYLRVFGIARPIANPQ